MCKIGDRTPYDETDKDKLIEYRLVKKPYEVSISLLELSEEDIIVDTDFRSFINLTKVRDIVPHREYKKRDRKPYSKDDGVLGDGIFMVGECGRDIGNRDDEDEKRYPYDSERIDPRPLDDEDATYAIFYEIFDSIGLTSKIERFEDEGVEFMERDHE